ncbi:MAG TPA: serine/threonine-protein kinase, partial [Polyangiaceae bacterium]|nr:serine/threonine-protein kinase [Polyangiaceae bacterium]
MRVLVSLRSVRRSDPVAGRSSCDRASIDRELASGALIGRRYRLARVLGSGAYGVVYEAEHTLLTSRVAIKFLSGALEAEPSEVDALLERFRFEAQISARLAPLTEHVVAVHDAGLHRGIPYLVMELAEGATLANEIARHPLELRDVAVVLRQIGDALAAAHAAGIAHGDVKPANVLGVRHAAGEPPRYKLTDFGVATPFAPTLEGLSPPADRGEDGILGSPAYMSPETMRGEVPSNGEGDVWALGVVAYQALTGSLPFVGDQSMEVAVAILTGTYTPPSVRRRGLARSVDDLFEHVFAKDRSRRIRSAPELCRAFTEIVRGLAPSPTLVRRTAAASTAVVLCGDGAPSASGGRAATPVDAADAHRGTRRARARTLRRHRVLASDGHQEGGSAMSRAHVYATDTVAAPPASVREAWDLLDDARTVVRSRRLRHDETEEPGHLSIGSMFADRFRIEHFVARGGAGAVWEATDTRAPRGIEKVALKILTSWSQASASVLERFRREAEIASELSGPHFPRVVARGFDHDPPYLALELLEGETLAKRLVACGKLTPKECVEIAAGMAAALTEAHALGIVHRDISPTNVFLAKAPDATVKILDFGIAKRDVFDATLTESGMLMGTPHFMSPEQLQKAHTVDFETDLWGMGVVLYRCLLGRPPFLGRAAEVLLKIISEDPDVPSSFAVVGPDIDAFFRSALSKDPKARFPSARAMAAAFEAAAATLPGGDGSVVRARGERSLSPTSTRATLPDLDVTRAYTRETLAAIDAIEVVD